MGCDSPKKCLVRLRLRKCWTVVASLSPAHLFYDSVSRLTTDTGRMGLAGERSHARKKILARYDDRVGVLTQLSRPSINLDDDDAERCIVTTIRSLTS